METQNPTDLEMAFRRALARQSMAAKGYSLRTAAPLLGVHFGHLHQVLQGQRQSRRLLAQVMQLPSLAGHTTHVVTL